MTLDHDTPPRSNSTNHDHIYTTLLGVLGALLVMSMLTINSLRLRPTADPESRASMLLVLSIEGWNVAIIAIGLVVRLIFPAHRRWPTLGVNLLLLLCFPLGTALAIYGFCKVDKHA